MRNNEVKIQKTEVLSDNWYTLRKITFDFRKMNGTWETVSREAYDRGNGATILLYNRALRNNPALQGKLVLKLTIEPTGQVSDVQVVSSELGDEELERKLVQRIRMFTFVAKDVPSVTTTKPIDFFPA